MDLDDLVKEAEEGAQRPAAKKPEIQKVGIKHDAIMDFMLTNPTLTQQQVAAYFGVTQSWLSIIIHSDTFQAQLSDKKAEMFAATVIPLRQKVVGVAHMGVEKLAECLENASPATDKDFIVNTTQGLLKNLDFGTGASGKASPGNVQTTIYNVGRDSLEQARNVMRALHTPEKPVIEGEITHGKEQNSSTTELSSSE